MDINWQGVFPAITTQFNQDESINYAATQQQVDRLIQEGVDGIIALGTVGENCSLHENEKIKLLSAVKEAVADRVPLLSGAAEYTTQGVIHYIHQAMQVGVDGIMLLPGMVYSASEDEVITHYQTVAHHFSDVPIMVYNNPAVYGVDVSIAVMTQLVQCQNIVAIKESSSDTRRITELFNHFGERFIVFGGVDDIALECLLLGAKGWVSGLTNAFPKESVTLYKLACAGRLAEARALYRWFLPLLRLDTLPTLVQCIKLVDHLCGQGAEWVRAPRRPLQGEARQQVINLVEQAMAQRPNLPVY
ncbi:dihydrodipicolinate synthase family protein [Zooshikella marina]|uniref:dihydrodipicolinate synthase family protein n=1 Tax=Zooshikella ganghwensis TaxID=202772 RepID=UPI001BB02C49|nr:dihydrodipicolinate synthase family protein [Zooshikella ganghwensis]MBU2705289.1 dihydrodipicolinate synthase family protein [Zooshikella ganghwensis]